MIKDYQKAWAKANNKLYEEISKRCWESVAVAHDHPEQFAKEYISYYDVKDLYRVIEVFRKVAGKN